MSYRTVQPQDPETIYKPQGTQPQAQNTRSLSILPQNTKTLYETKKTITITSNPQNSQNFKNEKNPENDEKSQNLKNDQNFKYEEKNISYKFCSPMSTNTVNKENYQVKNLEGGDSSSCAKKPPKTPILSVRSSLVQREAVIGIIKEETESEIAGYESGSLKESYLRFQKNCSDFGFEKNERNSRFEKNENFEKNSKNGKNEDFENFEKNEIFQNENIDEKEKAEYCHLLKKTVKEIFLEKKKELEEEFKKRSVFSRDY